MKRGRSITVLGQEGNRRRQERGRALSKVTAAAAEVSTPPGLLCHVSEGADPASPARRERGTDNERERQRWEERQRTRGKRGLGAGMRSQRRKTRKRRRE